MISFVLFGFLSVILVKLSYEDWKTKLVDVPVTLFASGFVTAAFLFNGRFVEFLGWAIIFILAGKFLKPFSENNRLLGAGDISILSFLLPALWFINVFLVGVFLILFGLLILVWFRNKLKDKSEKPLVPVITVCWVLIWIVFQIFFV